MLINSYRKIENVSEVKGISECDATEMKIAVFEERKPLRTVNQQTWCESQFKEPRDFNLTVVDGTLYLSCFSW